MPNVCTCVRQLRVFFYLRMIAMEDEAFQKKGMVSVILTGDSVKIRQLDSPQMKESVKEMTGLSDALPGYSQCIHVCIPNLTSFGSLFIFTIVRLTLAALNKLITTRLRIHSGTYHKGWLSLRFLAVCVFHRQWYCHQPRHSRNAGRSFRHLAFQSMSFPHHLPTMSIT